MMSLRIWLILASLVLILTFTACGAPDSPPSEADIQTAISETLTAAPDATDTPIPEPEITLEPSPTTPRSTPTKDPGKPVDAEVNVAYLNLRTGPSTFFEVIETLEEGTQVVAVSRLPENTWVEVEINTGGEQPTVGWMFTDYLVFADDFNLIGVADFPASQIITGRVEDEFGEPIEGVLIAIITSTADDDLRSDTVTDEMGSFTTYLPKNLTGILDIEVISPICGSTLMDENCQIGGHILLNDQIFISIPQEQQEVIFVYETAAYTLTGTVVDNKSQPVVDVNITATRDDGAVSYSISREDGEFYLPISEGIWEIFTVKFDPRVEGDTTTVTIADSIPEPITLKAPN